MAAPKRRAPRLRASRKAVDLAGPAQSLVRMGDLAQYLAVSHSTVKRLVRNGDIPAVRIGDGYRFDLAAVRSTLAGGRRLRGRR